MSIGYIKTWPYPPTKFTDLDKVSDYARQLYIALCENSATVQSGISSTIVTVSPYLEVYQVAHGFAAMDIIRPDGDDSYAKALADSAAHAEVVGIVTSVESADRFTFYYGGLLESSSVPAYAAGTAVYLSPTVAGGMTNTEPTGATQISKPVGIIIHSSESMLFFNYRGMFLPAASTHNSLQSIQGGAADEYYHLSATNYGQIANWNTAYGWGNHASAGYLTSVTAHNALSTTHGDTTADTVVRGDVITGQGATPKWARLAFPGTPTGKVLQATATDVGWSAAALGTAAFTASTAYATAAQGTDARTPTAHQLDTATYHTVSGLTPGHFLKATGATTFAFGAHGLTYSDVGAAASGHNHSGVYDPAGSAAAVTPTTLGLVIGTNTQAYSARLGEIAALAVTDSNIIVGDGASWVAETGATARTSLGLAIGTNVQAYNSNLTGINQALDTTATPSWPHIHLTTPTVSQPLIVDADGGLISVSYSTLKTSLVLTQNDVANITTTSGPTFDHVHLSSGQVGFPAAQSASADVNTLDDYEEGTWTAAFACGTSGTITINNSYKTGTYTKIGRLVTITGYFVVTSVSSPVGSLTITGLPFACAAGNHFYSAISIDAYSFVNTATTQIMAYIAQAASAITVEKFSAGTTAVLAGDVQANTGFVIGGTYMAAT